MVDEGLTDDDRISGCQLIESLLLSGKGFLDDVSGIFHSACSEEGFRVTNGPLLVI